jgi:single-strand DNA-binding protein
MNEIWTSIVGNVATQPKMALTNNGLAVTSFRLASSVRRWDKVNREYVDDQPSFVTVTCWRRLAENVASSVSKGQPVLVHGRLKIKEWVREDGRKGTTAEMEASALGHDLNLGTSMWAKHEKRGQTEPATVDPIAEELKREVSLEPIGPGPDEVRETVAA